MYGLPPDPLRLRSMFPEKSISPESELNSRTTPGNSGSSNREQFPNSETDGSSSGTSKAAPSRNEEAPSETPGKSLWPFRG